MLRVMTERREIKQRSAAVWARVREAYLAGEPAASVARRFDVGLGNLRYRAHAEGWTRKAALAGAEAEAATEEARWAGRADRAAAPDPAARPEPPREIDPATALQTAMRRAGGLLAEGRATEAATLLKAAEALSRLTGQGAPAPADAVAGPPDDAHLNVYQRHRAARDEAYSVFRLIEHEAGKLALQMLADDCHALAIHSLAAFHWRAIHLGPAVAARDEAQARDRGVAWQCWDEDGTLLPLPRAGDPETAERHARQFADFDDYAREVRAEEAEWEAAEAGRGEG